MTLCVRNRACPDCTHDVGHPYVACPDNTVWCLPCYARAYGRPVIEPNHGPRTVIRP